MTEEVDYCKDITEKSFRKELSGVTKNEKYFWNIFERLTMLSLW